MTRTSIVDLHSAASLSTIEERLTTLRERYIHRAILNKNPMMEQVIEEYNAYKGGRELRIKTLLCGVETELFDLSNGSIAFSEICSLNSTNTTIM